MADEPKPATPDTPPAEGANISPAPTAVTDGPPPGADGSPAPAGGPIPPAADASRVQAEPLADGTVPTVLSTGSSHKSVPKGRATITSIYRKADVLTTLFTFAGAVVAAGIIFGVYAYINRSKPNTAKAPTVTSLDKAELNKLQAFFEGNAGGKNPEILTFTSSSFFKERVAISSDLKVVGGLQVSAGTTLADLIVEKTAALGVTDIRGSLNVTGPLNARSPAILGGGVTVNGNATVSGNGSFGGSLSAGSLNIRDLSVAGTLNIAGHLAITGKNPSAAPGSEAGSGASVSVTGNDSSGTVTITTGNVATQPINVGGLLARVIFSAKFNTAPRVVITPVGQNGSSLRYYVLKTADDFTIGSSISAQSNTQYVFDYWVIQ